MLHFISTAALHAFLRVGVSSLVTAFLPRGLRRSPLTPPAEIAALRASAARRRAG